MEKIKNYETAVVRKEDYQKKKQSRRKKASRKRKAFDVDSSDGLSQHSLGSSQVEKEDRVEVA